MITYHILRHPGHNRVYFQHAEKLVLAEFEVVSKRLGETCHDIELVDRAGLQYLSFSYPRSLDENELGIIAGLSSQYGIFQLLQSDDHGTLLIPQELPQSAGLDEKISTVLKYAGKTNELFTRLMINVAHASSDFSDEERISLLDPVAGKGTTLFEAAAKGFDATGIELEEKVAHETMIFFRKFLEMDRLKHTLTRNKLYSEAKGKSAHIQQFEYAQDKAGLKDQDRRKKLDIISGTTLHAGHYFRSGRFHLIVGDLPYGIAHGNVAKKKQGSKTRDPSALLTNALPGWYKSLKVGGAMVLAWNSFVLSRDTLISTIEKAGFVVLKSSPYDHFLHRVDQSIRRDIIVARKEA